MKLKLATINFWGLPWPFSVKKKERLRLLTSLINKEQFDIVALQEIWTNYDINAITKTCLGYHALDKRNPFFNHSGLVILAKHELRNGLYIPFEGALLSLEFPSRKGILRCDVELQKTTIQIINTHVYYDVNAEQTKKQKKQLDQLIDILDHRPTIVLGDFNRQFSTINLPSHFQLISESDNPSINLRNEYSTKRFNKINSTDRLPDYIFANFPVSAKKSYLIQDPIFSDHYPVVSEIEI